MRTWGTKGLLFIGFGVFIVLFGLHRLYFALDTGVLPMRRGRSIIRYDEDPVWFVFFWSFLLFGAVVIAGAVYLVIHEQASEARYWRRKSSRPPMEDAQL